MILELNIGNSITIHSVNDLFMLGKLEEAGTTKLNRSKIARDLSVDRRTVNKYIKGYQKKKTRTRKSQLDEYYDLVNELLHHNATQVFFYKRVLWQYLKDNHGLQCAQSSFRRWISKHDEFQSYFNGITNRTVNGKHRDCTTNHHTMHHSPLPGEETQLDWKESMNIKLKDGNIVTVNIFALMYSYSRFKIYQLSLTKTQNVLFHLLDTAFEQAGGVPNKLKTDNMKTVMDKARTDYSAGKINYKFKQFADEYGFEVKPCKAGQPEVKAKVEAPMKLYLYEGQGFFLLLDDMQAFPFIKEIKDFDFQPTINKTQIVELESLGFIDNKENIVFLGPSGVGKTHLATSIGILAAKKRYSTYFIKCHDLIVQLKKAKLENRLDDRIKHFNLI